MRRNQHHTTNCGRNPVGIRKPSLRKRSPQLVWSGPEASGLAGDTGDVYEQLFSSAKNSLWVASFVSDHDPDVFGDLAANIDANPGLEVRLLLNIDRRRREEEAPEQDSGTAIR